MSVDNFCCRLAKNSGVVSVAGVIELVGDAVECPF